MKSFIAFVVISSLMLPFVSLTPKSDVLINRAKEVMGIGIQTSEKYKESYEVEKASVLNNIHNIGDYNLFITVKDRQFGLEPLQIKEVCITSYQTGKKLYCFEEKNE